MLPPVLSAVLLVMLAGAAAGLIYQATGRRADARQFPPPGRFVNAGSVRLHVDCRGEGPAVVLESGIAASSLNWRLVQERAARFARVCAYDRAGLAWSDEAPAARTLDGMVDDLAAVVDAVAPGGPVILVGHSFGGLIVRGFAARHPHRVAGLVLVDPLHEREWLEAPRSQRHLLRGGIFLSRVGILLARLGIVRACLVLLSRGRTGVPRAVGRSFGRRAFVLMSRIVGQVTRLPDEAVEAIRAHWCRPESFRAMARHLTVLPAASRDAMRLGPPGNCPLVVLTAALNAQSSIAAQRELAGLSSRGRQIVVEDAGHWLQIDRPEAVVEAIREIAK